MIEEKIKELGFEVPEVAKPLAADSSKQVGNLVMTSGRFLWLKEKLSIPGKLAKNYWKMMGKMQRRFVLNCLAAIKGVIGNLDKIVEVVKLTVFVASADNFTAQPKVANGASELIGKIFGDAGKHAFAVRLE